MFASVEFKCLLAATIGRFEFERDGKREVLLRRGSPRNPGGIYQFLLRRWLGGEFSFIL